MAGAGLTTPAGEQGRSVLEQTRSRPTCEINGITGGYTGDGFKTVIPAKASAKISLPAGLGHGPEEDPRRLPRPRPGAPPRRRHSANFKAHGGSAAVTVPADGAFLRKAATALGEEWGNEAALIGSGGSIPVAGDFKHLLGLDTLLIGFARDDDRIHSPNEKYNLSSFHKGIRSWVRILAALAD